MAFLSVCKDMRERDDYADICRSLMGWLITQTLLSRPLICCLTWVEAAWGTASATMEGGPLESQTHSLKGTLTKQIIKIRSLIAQIAIRQCPRQFKRRIRSLKICRKRRIKFKLLPILLIIKKIRRQTSWDKMGAALQLLLLHRTFKWFTRNLTWTTRRQSR